LYGPGVIAGIIAVVAGVAEIILDLIAGSSSNIDEGIVLLLSA
jgi:hypothetical protein